jgi:two-component system cell cycle sensor histidine kinase/response regulator CckA
VHQVLLNLSVNARDAMPDGGTLRLRAENLTLDPAAANAIANGRPGAFVALAVEDTGSGIPPDVLKEMWQPFFTTKAADKGTGLGLSTVRGIVQNHNGFIDVQTAVGRGTCFRVYFPAVAEKETNGTRPPVPQPRDGHGELILVVDDEARIRDMTSTMLTRRGYRVIVAADGAEAVAIFAQRASEIRLVITDLHMPNLDGALLARALHRINAQTKVLVMSGHSSTLGNRPAWYKPDEFADAFLAKPFKPDVLLNKVQELLNASSAR